MSTTVCLQTSRAVALIVGLGLVDTDQRWERHRTLVRSHRAPARLALPAGVGQ